MFKVEVEGEVRIKFKGHEAAEKCELLDEAGVKERLKEWFQDELYEEFDELEIEIPEIKMNITEIEK